MSGIIPFFKVDEKNSKDSDVKSDRYGKKDSK